MGSAQLKCEYGFPIVHAMEAVTLAGEMPLYSACLKYVLVDVAKDYSMWELRMESDLLGHGLWLLSSECTTDAKAKQLVMQHLSDNTIREEGSADGGCALWNSLAAAFKEKMAFRISEVFFKLN